MNIGVITIIYLLGDHCLACARDRLGSTSITTDSSGANPAEIRYYPWGKERYTSGTTPTTYYYTGQRLESSLGLYFYNSRWYDPMMGRFIQADTIVPDLGDSQAYDRYIYVKNNPLVYTDPSGHDYCDERWADPEECKSVVESPFYISPELYKEAEAAGYKYALDRGIQWVFQLQNHQGWWTKYINSDDPDEAWKFLLVLAFTYESYSYSGMSDADIFNKYMTESIINKSGDLYNEFGTIGLFIYIGGRETLYQARGGYSDNDPHWQEGTREYLNTWDLDYLNIRGIYNYANIQIKEAWPLIVAYDGTIFGSGAYEYGISPPLNPPTNKIIWETRITNKVNPWTQVIEPYIIYFRTK